MVEPDLIADEEIILRRITEAKRVARGRHFKLRADIGEEGVSCVRGLQHSAQLLEVSREGAWVAMATAREIRAIGLDVLVIQAEGIEGHCEIRSAAASLDEQEIRDQLAGLFKPVP